jgi:hypothetical protein
LVFISILFYFDIDIAKGCDELKLNWLIIVYKKQFGSVLNYYLLYDLSLLIFWVIFCYVEKYFLWNKSMSKKIN